MGTRVVTINTSDIKEFEETLKVMDIVIKQQMNLIENETLFILLLDDDKLKELKGKFPNCSTFSREFKIGYG